MKNLMIVSLFFVAGLSFADGHTGAASNQGGALNVYYPEAIQLSDDVVFVRFYYEGMTEVNGETSPYRTRVTMNWVKEGGNWVAKTQHYSPASYGGVHVPQASDFSDE